MICIALSLIGLGEEMLLWLLEFLLIQLTTAASASCQEIGSKVAKVLWL
jgi:hypothetical protein